jgi:hypothetical protein
MKYKSLILIIFPLLVGTNIWIIKSTQENLVQFSIIPPHTTFDFTRKRIKKTDTPLENLLDNNKLTVWKKGDLNSNEFDIELELGLTHKWDGVKYLPQKYDKVLIEACDDFSKNQLTVQFFFKEGISMEKELRLPLVLNFDVQQFEFSKELIVPINSNLELKEVVSRYNGKDIYLLGMRLKFPNLDACISGLKLL